jgi:glycosyltransferase involved in cell wall biosynthesis
MGLGQDLTEALNEEPDRPVFHVLPRGMNFSVARASSIDLFVSEVAACSRFPVEIIAEADEPTLPAAKLHRLPDRGFAATTRRARFVAALAAKRAPRLVIVQQHLPSAAAIARRIDAPVLLQRHNFMRPPRAGLIGGLLRRRQARALNALAGLTFVSEAAREEFAAQWPEVTTPRWVIPNGVDIAAWRPAESRDDFALVVGRATPEKGLLEAAEALAVALADKPGWNAAFIVSGAKRGADYLGLVRQTLAPLGPRAEILVDIPFASVKALNERAAIALIPSKWREPFGRTCLEAHAGGAAVISSGSGGLREISGDNALYASGADVAALTAALRSLIADETLRSRLARHGRRRVAQRFDLPVIAARLDDACEQACAMWRARRK